MLSQNFMIFVKTTVVGLITENWKKWLSEKDVIIQKWKLLDNKYLHNFCNCKYD